MLESRLFPSTLLLILLLLCTVPVNARTPSYLFNDVGKASLCGKVGFGTLVKPAIAGNTLLRTLTNARLSRNVVSPARPGGAMIQRQVIPFFDILEPLETLWEFYVNREDIMEELLKRGMEFTKRNSVRALGFLVVSFASAELLARAGVIGDRGEGLVEFVRESELIHEAAEEKVFQKSAGFLTDTAMDMFRRYRRWNEKSKFAVAVSVGALFSRAAVQTTVVTVKVGIVSFIILEGLAFTGVIGDPGESLLEWIDDHRDQTVEWQKKIKRFRVAVRKHVNMKSIERFYEAAVDEEKIASMGFAAGSVMAMFT